MNWKNICPGSNLTPLFPPLLSKLKIPSFDWLRMVSEVEPPEAGERGTKGERSFRVRRVPRPDGLKPIRLRNLAGTEIGNCSGLIYQTAFKNDNKAFVGEVMKRTQGKLTPNWLMKF
jgi:hypothetical protein